MLPIKSYFTGLTKNTILLACGSLFADIATEMLYPVLPIYMSENLKANGSIIGLIEGIASAVQNIIQGFSGYIADKFQRRKRVALFGYILSTVAKPFIGLATNWQFVLTARVADRLGSGCKSAPRDALVADSVEEKHRGKAFGLEGFGDNLGAFLGPILTVFLFFTWHIKIHYLFFIALIPGTFAVIMILLVKEKRHKEHSSAAFKLSFRDYPRIYWKYIFVTILFGIGNSSNSFIILQLRDNGASLVMTVFIYALYNLVAAIISYPSGVWSDKFGRKPLLMISFAIFFLCYTGFAFTSQAYMFLILFIFYGIYQGIFRSVGKSYAADFIPAKLRASGIGWYSTAIGLSGLFASLVAGQMWDHIGHSSVFIFGAASSILGLMALVFLIPKGEAVNGER